jgi:hypothetical protein
MKQEQIKQIIDKLIDALRIGANGHVYFKNIKKEVKSYNVDDHLKNYLNFYKVIIF